MTVARDVPARLASSSCGNGITRWMAPSALRPWRPASSSSSPASRCPPVVTARRFSPPWTFEEANNVCFIVKDANGFEVSYVYFEDEPGRRAAADHGHIAKL